MLISATMVAQSESSLGRGLDILLALDSEEAAANGGLGVVRIAKQVGREKSQVSRALKTLGDKGLVERDALTLDYRLGWRLFALAAQAGERRLLTAAPEALSALVVSLGETVHISVLEGSEVLTVLSQAPDRAVAATDRSGFRTPATCTSSGRALLLDHERAELELLFEQADFPTRGPGAPRDVGQLYERILAARANGYALANEEFEAGLVGAAAPIRDFRGRIVAALNVSAPEFRFAQSLDQAGREIKEAADELSSRLGFSAAARSGAGAGKLRTP